MRCGGWAGRAEGARRVASAPPPARVLRARRAASAGTNERAMATSCADARRRRRRWTYLVEEYGDVDRERYEAEPERRPARIVERGNLHHGHADERDDQEPLPLAERRGVKELAAVLLEVDELGDCREKVCAARRGRVRHPPCARWPPHEGLRARRRDAQVANCSAVVAAWPAARQRSTSRPHRRARLAQASPTSRGNDVRLGCSTHTWPSTTPVSYVTTDE